MKRQMLWGLLALLLVNLISSCTLNECGGNKDRFLAKFETLVEEASTADLAYSDPKWEKYDNRFRTMVEDCYPEYEAELRGRERRQFWAKFVKYYYKRYGAGVARDMLDQGELQIDNLTLDLEDISTEGLEDLLSTIGDDVEKWGEELENWANDLLEVLENVGE